jgi:lysozyme
VSPAPGDFAEFAWPTPVTPDEIRAEAAAAGQRQDRTGWTWPATGDAPAADEQPVAGPAALGFATFAPAAVRAGVLLGVDVSAFQGAPDWPKVKASGVSFAFAKVSEGRSYRDPQYERNRAGIPAAGLVPGAYHFLVRTSPAADQADWFCRWADPHAMHALDVEARGPLDVRGFVQRYRQHYPRKPLLIYTGPQLWRSTSQVGYDGAGFGPLWVAGYRPNLYVPGGGTLARLWGAVGSNDGGVPFLGWTDYTLMQFTANATVPGIAGTVDGDAFRGTLDELRALTGDSGATPPPPPPTEDDMPLTDADIARLRKEIGDEVLGREVQTWYSDAAHPDGKVSLIALASLALFNAQTAAKQTDTLEGTTAQLITRLQALPTLEQLSKGISDQVVTALAAAGLIPVTPGGGTTTPAGGLTVPGSGDGQVPPAATRDDVEQVVSRVVVAALKQSFTAAAQGIGPAS